MFPLKCIVLPHLFAVINCYRCLYKQHWSIYRSFCTLNLVIQSKTLINCHFIAISISPVWFLCMQLIQMFGLQIINRIIRYPFQPYYTTKVAHTYTCVQSLCSWISLLFSTALSISIKKWNSATTKDGNSSTNMILSVFSYSAMKWSV